MNSDYWEWENRGNGNYTLGEKVRGIVRENIANVIHTGSDVWEWYVRPSILNRNGNSNNNGVERSFLKAVEAAEKELGLLVPLTHPYSR